MYGWMHPGQDAPLSLLKQATWREKALVSSGWLRSLGCISLPRTFNDLGPFCVNYLLVLLANCSAVLFCMGPTKLERHRLCVRGLRYRQNPSRLVVWE